MCALGMYSDMHICVLVHSDFQTYFPDGNGAIVNEEWNSCFPKNICSHSKAKVCLAILTMMEVPFRTDV